MNGAAISNYFGELNFTGGVQICEEMMSVYTSVLWLGSHFSLMTGESLFTSVKLLHAHFLGESRFTTTIYDLVYPSLKASVLNLTLYPLYFDLYELHTFEGMPSMTSSEPRLQKVVKRWEYTNEHRFDFCIDYRLLHENVFLPIPTNALSP